MSSTVVLEPGAGFSQLRDTLAGAGWAIVSSAERPIVAGEPEHAVFERSAGERLFYTYNPAVQLRVLELPDGMDAAAAGVAPVGRQQVDTWLRSDDERTALRGVLAARQMPDGGLLERIYTLRGDPRPTVASAAAKVSDELRRAIREDTRSVHAARDQALTAIDVLKGQVRPLLEALTRDRSGQALEAVKPHDGDYAKTFVAGAVDAARDAYGRLWSAPGELRHPDPAQTIITCEIAPAGMLAYDNELSRRFPGGYRGIAHLLHPHRVWVAWKCLRPGADAGTAYDGLVWLDDHWAWFPRPYRVLSAGR